MDKMDPAQHVDLELAKPPLVRSERIFNCTQVRHGFFGRKGGVSDGIYESLNAGPGSDDDPKNIIENRARIARAIHVLPENLLSLYQIHSPDVLTLSGPFKGERPKADAMVTRSPNIGLAILTADCAPVLFVDPLAGVIGAAHAGWKGAVAGVLEATVKAMNNIGATPSRTVAAIGPCIGKASYEVGPDFEAEVLGLHPDAGRFFHKGPSGKAHFDLKGFCANRLRASGVGVVDILPDDTFGQPDDYFSNRRRNHAGEPDYGRQVSAIMLRPSSEY